MNHGISFTKKNMRLRARQDSRKHRLLDVFNQAVYLSDPKISLMNIKERLKYHKKQEVSDKVRRFYKDT